jgi:hypothetical protein
MPEKRAFIERFADFYITNCDNQSGLLDLQYSREGADEWVYAIFRSGCRKRFNITGDSNLAILVDFVNFINNFENYQWIM